MTLQPRLTDPDCTCWFYTLRLQDAASDLLTRHIDLLRLSVRLCQLGRPFDIVDAVVLPDRLHMIWALSPQDRDDAGRWKTIKATFARHLPDGAAGAGPIWQRHLWRHAIRTAADLAECQAVIRLAPVRAGLVAQPGDWPYCRASRLTGEACRDSDPAAAGLHLVKG